MVINWLKRPRSESVDDVEKHLVYVQRLAACDRWWKSMRIENDGSRTEEEFKRYIIYEKKRWWRWNFGEQMP